VRGNPTTISQWVSNSQYVTKYMTYDTTGQITSTTDGDGNVTSYDYSDNYYVDNGTSSPTAYAPPVPTHAHATTVTLPTVHGQSFSTHSGYYYGDHRLAFTTDLNGNSTYYHYSDPLDRLTQTVYPLGWKMTQYTSPIQTDVYTALSSPTPSSACGASCLHTSIILDGLERVIQTVRPDGSMVDTTYNSMGLVQSVSNPYQSSSDSTYGVTSYLYDIWGRVCMQNNPDNSLSQTATCTAKGNSALQFSYIVNGGYKTDENGNTWGYFYDPLGKLASVVEPNGATTAYTHDVLGNLIGVSQPSRPRTFGYDGLSRLVTATNPESGNVCYGTWNGSNCTGGYDGNGNLISRTDARGVATTYNYDAWNRLTSKSYSDGATSRSCYQYDASGVPNGNGRLANLWTQSNSAGACAATAPITGFLTKRSILAYDSMGRVWNEQQCVLGQCSSGPTPPCATSFSPPYYQSYCYDLAGNVTWSANGATNVPGVGSIQLTQAFDWAGRPSTLTSSWNDASHPQSLFTANPTDGYTPSGALQDFDLGDNYILVNKTYDNRLRVTAETAAHQ
jgi:YD repeat-containing protein